MRPYAMILLACVACGGRQGGGGGGATVGYCASHDYVDAMFGEPAHIEFCKATEAECRASAAEFAEHHGMQMSCVASSTMYCYGYEDGSGEESCSITAQECERSRAADRSDQVDPVLAELGATPVAKTPCREVGSASVSAPAPAPAPEPAPAPTSVPEDACYDCWEICMEAMVMEMSDDEADAYCRSDCGC
jgi:hypothetical protein